jgi:hypothetical protein
MKGSATTIPQSPVNTDLETLKELYFELAIVEDIGKTPELTARLDKLEHIIIDKLA